MYSIRVHKVIDQMVSFYHRIGYWHGGDRPTASRLRLKSFYYIYHLFFVSSLLIGSITGETVDDSIFLAEATIISTVLNIKVWMLLWKQKQIMALLNRICVFSIQNDKEFAFCNVKVEKFVKFVIVFICATIAGAVGCSGFPFFGKERLLIVDIAFPLDWKKSEIGFWMAHSFFVIGALITLPAILFSILIWYLLLHCAIRYKVVGMEICNMGRITGKAKMTEKENQAIFYQDLVASIEAHLDLRRLIDELESFLSKLFLLQFATSGLCICGSIYCLAFDISNNSLERIVHVYTLFYNTAELFMITYFGNEITLSSSCLTYSLFESEWIGQPHSTKTCIIIFGEYLKRSEVMLIGKLYPLTLETFTRILKSSYSLFNISKNFKE
ncbi:odorant receptor Or2-like [Bradysia coprophila]|uniref:odorant receptor Or2-like n=1 Tax=Bradysia coprophila TaxID=38358 RepID=UPI00187DB398|nr:odorant receptor Or2-like [Bradysia coprophila]